PSRWEMVLIELSSPQAMTVSITWNSRTDRLENSWLLERARSSSCRMVLNALTKKELIFSLCTGCTGGHLHGSWISLKFKKLSPLYHLRRKMSNRAETKKGT